MVICHMVRFNIIFYLQYSDISEHHIPVTSPVPTQSGMHFFQYPPSLDQTRTALFLVPTQSGLDWYCTFSSTDVVYTRLVLHFFQYRRSLDQTGTALFPVPTQSRLDWYCTLCSTSLVGTSMGHSFGAVPVQSGHSPELENSQYFSSRDIHRYCAQCSTSGCPTRLELEHVNGKSSRSNSSELELLDVPAHFPKHRRQPAQKQYFHSIIINRTEMDNFSTDSSDDEAISYWGKFVCCKVLQCNENVHVMHVTIFNFLIF